MSKITTAILKKNIESWVNQSPVFKGELLAHDERFPEGVNVSVMTVESPAQILSGDVCFDALSTTS